MQSSPLEIVKKDAGHLRILWDDGHESLYSFAVLRSQCPCAGCSARQRQPPGLLMHGKTTPTGIAAVGNYALTIAWMDGHSTGIYSYEWLREHCACSACGGLKPEKP